MLTIIQYVSAAIGLSPNTKLAELNPHFSYQVYLSANATGAAKELDADPRSAIRSCAQVADSVLPKSFLTKTNTFLGPWREFMKERNITEIPFSANMMTPLVENYMVESYKKSKFFNSMLLDLIGNCSD